MIRLLAGDCRDVLKTLEPRSVHCVVTSPPYYGLRDYGTGTWEGGDIAGCDHVVGEIRTGLGMAKLGERYAGGGHKASEPKPMMAKDECPKCGARRVDVQIGMEETPDAYVAVMVAVFREVWRVLRDDGVAFLNLGDSYANDTKWGGSTSGKHVRDLHGDSGIGRRRHTSGLKSKDLMMIPARVAIALQADGWYLRSDVIWHKPNPMPESCTDRPTSSHEHVFLLTKKANYFYDAEAVREDRTQDEDANTFRGGSYVGGQTDNGALGKRTVVGNKRIKVPGGWDRGAGAHGTIHRDGRTSAEYQEAEVKSGRNLRNVWTIATNPYAEAHFATFPPKLVETCIKAGTSERGCCGACGAPWKRIITKGKPDAAHRSASGADSTGGYNGQSTKGHDDHGVQNASDVKRRILEGMRERIATWTATCKCDAQVRPCTVLDPFIGAGTTAMVADRMGRDAIGIELKPGYGTMAANRVTDDAPLFAQISRV